MNKYLCIENMEILNKNIYKIVYYIIISYILLYNNIYIQSISTKLSFNNLFSSILSKWSFFIYTINYLLIYHILSNNLLIYHILTIIY